MNWPRTSVSLRSASLQRADYDKRIGERRVTVAPRVNTLKGWEIGEDDFGGVMNFHRHADQGVPAYVVDEVGDWVIAECSDCRKTVEFARSTDMTR